MEEPLRYHRTFGLDAGQLDELEARIEEVIADLFGVSQGTVSEIVTEFTSLIAQATEEFRPGAEEAKQVTRVRLALVGGTLWPYWSWERAPEMWAGKYKTTGHGSLIIGDEFGNIIFVSDPAPGCDHDMKKREGEVEEILDLADRLSQTRDFKGLATSRRLRSHSTANSTCVNMNTIIRSVLSAPPSSERLRISRPWKILFTDYRRPLNMFLDSFRAAIGLYFFELSFQ
jgi:hypothetical protein